MNKLSTLIPTSLYIHYPYCSMICSYCAFNKYLASSSQVDNTNLKKAYLSEMKHFKSMCDSKFGQRSINTIYFGGGTPSLADPSLFGSILDNIKSNFEIDDNCEVTLECNPTDADKLPDFKKIGINRVSLGIQSFDDEDLTFLGRKHTSTDAKKALEIASQNFDKVSFDMIYARRAEQTVQKWQTELNNALKLCTGPVSHVSLYTLVMEQDTPLGRNVTSGQVKLPDEDSEADLYEITRDLAESFGLKQYEVSNFARGRENECQHSLKGWSGQDYWGIGPGACSRLTSGESGETKRYAYMCVKHPTRWMASCEQNGHGIDASEEKELSMKERIQETLLMSLRTIYGINDEQFTKVTNGKKLKETLEWKEIERLERGGLLYYDNQRGHLYASRKGMALLDYIVRAIF